MNFALPIRNFEPQIAGLHNLIALSLATKTFNPAKLFFCSSIGAAMTTPRSDDCVTVVPEALIGDLSYAAATGYARSKLVAEHIVGRAVKEADALATILRIGQIIPSKDLGSQLWKPDEMIPLMVQSSLTVHALPDSLSGGDNCSWLDVDTLAKTIVELASFDDIARGQGTHLVYNLVHPRPFSWKEDFLPLLKAAGLRFESIPFGGWLKRLAASEQDITKNPSKKLLGFWEESEKVKRGDLEFDTSLAQSRSITLNTAERAIDDEVVKALVDAWKELW